MQKFVIQVVLLLVVVLVSTIYVFQGGNFNITPESNNSPQYQLMVGSSVVNVEIADTKEKRDIGLGGRDSIASDSGMLFTFDKPDKYSFWMKGMRFPLDFIWIRDNQVVDLLVNVPPPSQGQSDSSLPIYQPITYINEVLEVNAGFIASSGIKLGDKVQLIQVSPSSSQ